MFERKTLNRQNIVVSLMFLIVSIFIITNSWQKATVDLFEQGEQIPVGEIINNTLIEMEFSTDNNELDEIQILFATYNRKNEGQTIVTIKEKGESQTIYEGVIENSKLIDNKYKTLALGKKLKPNTQYNVSLVGKGAELGRAPTIWGFFSELHEQRVTINGEDIVADLGLKGVAKNFDYRKAILYLVINMIIYLLILSYLNRKLNIICNFLFKYRYIIALVVFIICVLCELNGSSIGMWQDYLSIDGLNKDYTLFGNARGIRSDEWAVNTPMVLSQYLNKTGSFPYFSDTIRGIQTDTFIVYGQPVWDIAVIFRPFHWGYLFLSAGKGLAFFWYGRLIALFLVSFEFGRLISKDSRRLSIIYAMLISFAPIIQWWFAINGLVEMFIFGQLAVLILKKYMCISSTMKRFIYVLVMAICAGGYILTLYPAWQIPLAYVFLVLAIWTVMENWKQFRFSYKDIVGVGLIGLVCIGIMMHVLYKSLPTIDYVMNTVYPGSRFETGGNNISKVFNYVINIFLPYKSEGLLTNQCEEAVFFDLFPMGYIVTAFILLREKKKDKLLIGILVANIFLLMWCTFKWNPILARVTLLKNVQPSRAYLAVGWTNILLLIRGLAISDMKISKKSILSISGVSAVALVIMSHHYHDEYMDKYMCIVAVIVIFGIFYSVLKVYGNKVNTCLILLCFLLMMGVGMTINPIQYGVKVVYDNQLIQDIEEINDDDVGLWIVEGLGFPYNNIPIMVGAATINSTNVYPAIERWELIDKNHSSTDIYNRYAHIRMNLQNAYSSKFNYGDTPDQFEVELNVEDLKLLDVKYIFTKNVLDELSTETTKLYKIYDKYGYKVYKVEVK